MDFTKVNMKDLAGLAITVKDRKTTEHGFKNSNLIIAKTILGGEAFYRICDAYGTSCSIHVDHWITEEDFQNLVREMLVLREMQL